jgi:hypothetical protein
MASELAKMYDELRAQPLSHHQALRVLAHRIGVDEDTVKRTLTKASSSPVRVSVVSPVNEWALR